jgi:WD40 repeat protein
MSLISSDYSCKERYFHNAILLTYIHLFVIFPFKPFYIVVDRNCVQLMNAHTGPITALSFSTTTGLLISGAKDSTLKLYNVSVTPSIGENIFFVFLLILDFYL